MVGFFVIFKRKHAVILRLAVGKNRCRVIERPRNIDIRKVGPTKVAAPNRVAADTASTEISVCSSDVINRNLPDRSREAWHTFTIGSPKDGPVKECLVKIRASQASPAQVRIAEVHARQLGATKLTPTRRSVAENRVPALGNRQRQSPLHAA